MRLFGSSGLIFSLVTLRDSLGAIKPKWIRGAKILSIFKIE
jgi:hypothetical protein